MISLSVFFPLVVAKINIVFSLGSSAFNNALKAAFDNIRTSSIANTLYLQVKMNIVIYL